MIKNEREYKITRAQAGRFERALAELAQMKPARGVDPKLPEIEARAFRSQLEDLRRELAEYEALRAGERSSLTIETLDELPRALIQGRIARGMSQEELGQQLRITKQQIQRYEATNYASASLTRLGEIAAALNLHFHGEVALPKQAPSLNQIFERLAGLGLERDFILDRLLPSTLAGELEEVDAEPDRGLMLRVTEVLRRVFEWPIPAILGGGPLRLEPAGVLTGGRFKIPKKVNERKLVAYAAYAHRLASFALDVTTHLEPQPIPTEAKAARNAILEGYGEVNFESTLRWVWSLGIPIVPLRDSGVFHGACWRHAGRNVIVLKQNSRAHARWLHDLLHELYHASVAPDLPERGVIEEHDPLAQRDDDEEAFATDFASDVALDARAEELVDLCVRTAAGRIERFKRVVPEVAARESVPTDALANYLAYRLSLQGRDWWGAATNLQVNEPDPWSVARDVFFEFARFETLPALEREILARGLSEVHS